MNKPITYQRECTKCNFETTMNTLKEINRELKKHICNKDE